MELWDVKQTARRTNTSEEFWRKRIRMGEIPIIRLGRLVRLDADVVRTWLAARVRPVPLLGEKGAGHGVRGRDA